MNGIGSIITAVVLAVCSESGDSLKIEFEKMGFNVEKSDQLTLLVSGEKSLFEQQFDIQVSEQSGSDHTAGVFIESVDTLSGEQTSSAVWPIEHIPSDYRHKIKRIEFEQPISFGPTSY